MPRSAESAATLRAIRWFTITHGITMGGFVILMAIFLGAVHGTQSGKADTLLEHPLQVAVVGLTVAMLMILLLLGRHLLPRPDDLSHAGVPFETGVVPCDKVPVERVERACSLAKLFFHLVVARAAIVAHAIDVGATGGIGL